MANAFDEFDEQPQTSGPVKITVGGNKPAASTGTVQAKPNAFDEFDQPQAKPEPTALEFGTDMAKHLGIGVLKGIPDLAKFVGSAPDVFAADRLGSTDEAGGADLAQRDRDMQSYLQSNFGPPDPNLPNGYTDQQRAQAWQAYQASGAYKPSPAATKNPSFGEMTEGALRAANLDPNVYFPTPEDPAQRVAEMAGSFGVQSMLGGELSVAQKLAQFGTGALAGGASQTLTEAVPEDWKPVTSFVSGMAIPMGLHAAGKGLGAGVKGAAEHVAPALPWFDKRKMAAQRLDSVINAPREQVINDLENAPELVPGSRPTAAKASADAGIGSFENALARNDDAFKAKLLQRQQENAAARVAPVHDIAEAQQPSAASDYFHSRMRELEQRADDLYNQHQSIADAEREAVGAGAPAADVGQRGRAALAQRFSQLNKEAGELWKALPDAANVAAQPMKAKVGELYNSMGPEEALSLHPIETQIRNIINSYGDTINFGRFKELRSAITTAMRERDMNPKAKGRLAQVLNGVEDAVGQSIDQQVAAEQQAVAAGQMNPEDTLANRLHADAQRVAGQGDMAGLSAGNEGAQAAPANAIPRDEGTRGAPDLGPAAPAGVQGLPQETGGDRFSVTAPDGRVTSVKARPDPARGLSAEDVLRQRFPDATITKETTNGTGNPAATARRPTLQPGEPRPASEPGRPGGAGVRPVSRGAESQPPRLNTGPREGDGSLKDLPRKVGSHTASAWPEAQRVAEDYMRKAGLPYDPPSRYVKVDPARAKRIADAYEQMKHAPDDPQVKAAYDAMAKETLAQYQSILDSGMTFDFIPKGAADPYNGNPRNMIEDVRNNKHMWVYSTEDGFGSRADFDPKKNPLLADSGFKFGDRPATVNDIFRAVHDYFGHVKEGVGFRADGEENAWRAHSAMYSPEARKAMTTETRGQNSWVNYGPFGETNRTAKSEDTHYADQKTGILPDWVVNEGSGDDNVGNVIREQFQTAGRSGEEGTVNGKLVQAFYDQMAKDMNKTPEEIADLAPAPEVFGPNDAVPNWAGGSQKLFQAGEYHPITAFIDHGSLKDSQHRIEQPLRDLMRDAYGRAENNVDRIGFTIDNNPDLYGRAREIAKDLGVTTDQVDQIGGYGAVMDNLARGLAPSKEKWTEITGAQQAKLPPPAKVEYPIGPKFYSPALKAIEGEAGTKAKRANAQQWMSILKGTPGVKADELNWLGVEDWLKEQNRPVTQQELADYIRQNQLEVTDTLLGSAKAGGNGAIEDASDLDVDTGYRETIDPDDDYFEGGVDESYIEERAAENADDYWNADTEAEIAGVDEATFKRALKEYLADGQSHPDYTGGEYNLNEETARKLRNGVEDAANELLGDARTDEMDILRQSYYDDPDMRQTFTVTMPDGEEHYYEATFDSGGGGRLVDENDWSEVHSWDGRHPYDETLRDYAREHAFENYYTPPEPKIDVPEGEPKPIAPSSYDRNANTEGDNYRELLLRIEGDNRLAQRIRSKLDPNARGAMPEANFDESHWRGRPNILAHVRFDTRDIGGKRSLFIQEVQSDWHQQGQKQGYAGPERAEKVSKLEQDARDAFVPASNKALAHLEKYGGHDQSEIDRTMAELAGVTPYYMWDRVRQLRERYDLVLRDARANLRYRLEDMDYETRNNQILVERLESRVGPKSSHDEEVLSNARARIHQLDEESAPLRKQIEEIEEARFKERNDWIENVESSPELANFKRLADEYRNTAQSTGVTPGPYADTKLWTELAMKRMLRWAAEHGYDQLVWHAGDLQNGGIISRGVDGFQVAKTHDGRWSYRQTDKSGRAQTRYETVSPSQFEMTYGKGAAKKVMEALADKPAMEEGVHWDDKNITHVQTPGYRYGSNIETFYSKLIPSSVEKLVKKYGSSIDRTPINLDGNQLQGLSIPITDELRKSVLAGQPLFQNGDRGFYAFNGKKSLIKLLQRADATTGVHELAHHFLEMYRGMAEGSDAPPKLKNDWRTVNNWWGANADRLAKEAGRGVSVDHVRDVLSKGSSGVEAIDRKVRTAMHEQWARAFEKYLGEGVAPTEGLKRVFERFKDWMSRIYQSLTGLNVDLSPQMRGVFDRMLGGEGAKPEAAPSAGPKMVTREQAQQYAAARGATKNLKETFGTPTVKSILKRPGSTYAYDIGDEAVASKLWGAGAKGAGQVREVMGAAGNTPEIKQAVTDAAVNSLRTVAIKGGRLDPASLDAWRAKHADALSALPDLDRKLQSAGAAEKALVEVGQRRAEAIKAVQQSAIGKLLNVSADADVVKTIGTMLGKRDSVQSMRQLATQAKGNPDAEAGLQSALAQHLIDRMVTPKGAFRPDTFQRYISQNWPAMREVFSPEQMNTIRAIAADLKREAQSFVAPGGGSNTAENLAAARRYGVEQPTLMGKVWRTVIGPALSGVGAAVGLSPQGWMGQAIGGLGAALGTHVIERLREKGLETVNDLVREAMLDPKLFAELLKIAPKRANTGSHMSLAQYLATTGARAAVMTRAEGERRKEKKFANGGSVVGEDVYTSPPAWAADVVNRYLGQSPNAGVIPNQQSFGSA